MIELSRDDTRQALSEAPAPAALAIPATIAGLVSLASFFDLGGLDFRLGHVQPAAAAISHFVFFVLAILLSRRLNRRTNKASDPNPGQTLTSMTVMNVGLVILLFLYALALAFSTGPYLVYAMPDGTVWAAHPLSPLLSDFMLAPLAMVSGYAMIHGTRTLGRLAQLARSATEQRSECVAPRKPSRPTLPSGCPGWQPSA